MKYLDLIEENKDLQLETLQELVSIRSVKESPVTTKEGEVYPFGEGIQKSFEFILKKAEEMGFTTENVDNYGGHIDYGYGEETVGIIGHLDVVTEGDGWAFDPYSGAVSNGYIYGRGTTDDKGPVVATLFAMKALKDSGYEPARKVRLILGLDEETDWEGMDYYFSKVKRPDFGFTPDADFPAINGEKGICNFHIVKKLEKNQNKGLELTRLSGGAAKNIVAERARAVVRAEDKERYALIRTQAENFRKEKGLSLHVKGVGKSLEITAEGKAAHGATPEKGLNAISILMEFLGGLNFSNDDVNSFVEFYNKYLGYMVNGEGFGVDFSDDKSGKLTLNVGIIELDKEAITIEINLRYPISYDGEQVYEKITPVIDQYDLGLVKVSEDKPIYMDPESPMVKTMVDSYVKFTGDTVNKPKVIGGATYAKASPNILGFGAQFRDDEDLMHQCNERLSLERFYLATKIYAQTIYDLTQPDFKFKPDDTLADTER